MFNTDPIVWLQSFASAPLTRVMDGISWCGYTGSVIAAMTLLAFAHRLRPALAILILIGLTAGVTDVAKDLLEWPRPYQVDQRVAALGSFLPADATDADTGFGFPSGHVATTTTVAVGLVWLFRWSGASAALIIWLALMATSRLYLGRHFVGDVIGGFVLGSAVAVVAVWALRLTALSHTASRTAALHAATLSTVVASIVVGLSWWAHHPEMTDAGVLFGFASATLVVIYSDVPDTQTSWRRRGWLLLVSAGGFALTSLLVGFGLREMGASASPFGDLVGSVVPVVAMLLLPVWTVRPGKGQVG